MRYASVCSGIEAATQAWHPLGFIPVWFSQFDPEHNYDKGPDFPSAVLAHHYPDVPNLGDMTKLSQHKFYQCPQISTSLLEGPHASPSVLPASEKDYLTSVLTSRLNLSEYLLENGPRGSSGKMFRGCLLQDQKDKLIEMEARKKTQIQTQGTLLAFFPPGQEETSPPKSLKKVDVSKGKPRKTTLSHGAYLIANISECHSDAEESLLSDILEKTGDHLLRYCLSKTACEGILHRAERRGKVLPEILRKALEVIAMGGGIDNEDLETM